MTTRLAPKNSGLNPNKFAYSSIVVLNSMLRITSVQCLILNIPDTELTCNGCVLIIRMISVKLITCHDRRLVPTPYGHPYRIQGYIHAHISTIRSSLPGFSADHSDIGLLNCVLSSKGLLSKGKT